MPLTAHSLSGERSAGDLDFGPRPPLHASWSTSVRSARCRRRSSAAFALRCRAGRSAGQSRADAVDRKWTESRAEMSADHPRWPEVMR